MRRATVLAPLIAVSILCLAPYHTAAAQDAPNSQKTPLERYLEAGIDANPELAAARRATERAHAERREAERAYLPTVAINARYTRSGGGRTIDFPLGDLLNPAYAALNDLTGTSAFPQIENESFSLLRSREQDTRVSLLQPLFQPEIGPAKQARRSLARAAEAGTASVRADLVARISSQYVAYLQANEAVVIFQAALESLNEAVRVSRSLVETGLATNDAVFRIEADRAAVEQDLAEAEVIRSLAAAAFNTTLARSPGAPIETMGAERIAPIVRGDATAADPEALARSATAHRPTIRQLDASIDASQAFANLERGSRLPSLALAADYGIQGENYAFDDDARFRTASVVMQWTLFDGRRRKARVQQATLRTQELEHQREQAEDLIALQIRQAVWQAELAERNVEVAERRVTSARNAFRLVERRFGEGLATQLDLLDGRAALTASLQSLSITRFDVLKRWIEVNRAVAR